VWAIFTSCILFTLVPIHVSTVLSILLRQVHLTLAITSPQESMLLPDADRWRVWCMAKLDFQLGIEISFRHFRIDLEDFLLYRVEKPLHWLNILGGIENEADIRSHC
jgi:hypothetical protein